MSVFVTLLFNVASHDLFAIRIRASFTGVVPWRFIFETIYVQLLYTYIITFVYVHVNCRIYSAFALIISKDDVHIFNTQEYVEILNISERRHQVKRINYPDRTESVDICKHYQLLSFDCGVDTIIFVNFIVTYASLRIENFAVKSKMDIFVKRDVLPAAKMPDYV